MKEFDVSKDYDRESFESFASDFLPDDYQSDGEDLYFDFKNIESGYRLGTCKSLDLDVFEFRTKSNRDPRVTLTKEVVSCMKKYGSNPNALAVFYAKESHSWRLSLITTDYTIEKGKIKTEHSNPRRFSFRLGMDCKRHTPTVSLIKKGKVLDIDDLKKRFAIEVVGKEFFAEYKVFYEDFVQYITGNRYLPKAKDKTEIHKANKDIFPQFLALAEGDNDKACKYARDYIKKMMGRLVFLEFLQKKGWLGVEKNGKWGSGDKKFLQNLFVQSQNKDDFLEKDLEPLFFGMLNTPETDREFIFKKNKWSAKLLSQFKKIPYLNGGLFECDSLDKLTISFPKEMFSNPPCADEAREFAGVQKNYPYDAYCGLLDFFARYNFTIDETDPADMEIGVEPEMLGKIFENLLEDNKDKGAFYTPKEIVQYMCRESLIAYLETDSKIDSKKIRNLVELKNADFTLQETKVLLNKLKEVKVCDPAVGSGAFPMGMLNELFACRVSLGEMDEFDANVKRAEIKKQIVRQNIYGVDIEKGAVDIARLRFWLAIIVDEAEPLPLPNLDYKIMQGNSLLECYEGFDLSKMLEPPTGGEFDYNEEQRTLLKNNMDEYFDDNNHEDKAAKNEMIKSLVFELARVTCGLKQNEPRALELYDKICNGTTDFFLWHAWFNDVFSKGGFDIVIGNPPYIGEKNHKALFEVVKKDPLMRQFYCSRMDYFYFFFHQALNICNSKGNCIFITTNYYVTADGAKKLRLDLKKRASIKCLLNFGEFHIFENALGQHNLITAFNKTYNKVELCKLINVHSNGFISKHVFDGIVQGVDENTRYNACVQEALYDEELNTICLFKQGEESPLEHILQKIQTGSEKLAEIADVNQGFISGADKVTDSHALKFGFKGNKNEGIFVLSKEELKKLRLNSMEKGIVKPLYKNSDIYRYGANTDNSEYLLFVDKSLSEKEFTKKYPNIMSHLLQYKDLLVKIRKRNNERTDTWFCLHRARNEEIFLLPKIIAPQRAATNTFGYNESRWYASADVYFITKSKNGFDLKYLLGLLNTRLYYLWLYYRGKRKGESLELYSTPLSDIPVKQVDVGFQNKVISLVEKILAAKKENPAADTSKLESQIDELVYDLYGLTEEEKDIVRGS